MFLLYYYKIILFLNLENSFFFTRGIIIINFSTFFNKKGIIIKLGDCLISSVFGLKVTPKKAIFLFLILLDKIF